MSSKQWKKIEALYGKPLAEVLIEEYQSCGNIRALADKLGVQPSVISGWVKASGLKFVTRIEREYILTPLGKDAVAFLRSVPAEAGQ